MSKLEQNPQRSSRFKLSNLTEDPFAISTLLVGFMSWAVAFVGSLVADLETSFPKFTWWGLVFELLLLFCLLFFYGLDLVDQYKGFLSSAFGVALVYTSNSATNLVYADGSSKAAASAGVILLSMMNIIWMFYFGSDNSSPMNRWIDSFSLRGPRHTNNPFNQQYVPQIPPEIMPNNGSVYPNSQSKYMSSTRLQGLEVFSEAGISPMANNNPNNRMSSITQNTNIAGIDSNLAIHDFPYTARALYSYESNPEDENEISFEKGEILKVNDIHSRWWQAKRSNGQIGICPSNYVELIE